MAKKNVFIVGLDEFNLKKLQRLPLASRCNFHAALEVSEIRNVATYSMPDLIAKATGNIKKVGGTVDAITAYYDFPATTIVPILCQEFGTTGPSLESIMACEHKYWSRLVQRKVIPSNIPPFEAFDPFDEEAYQKISLMPPFWVKPIKSFRSYLAYRINGPKEFANSMQTIREKIDFIGAPFQYVMERFGMPLEYTEMKERCLAESPLNGSQCTLEGYSYQGRVVVYGVVDSVRELDRSSFSRYEYPSQLPLDVQHRMIDAVRQVILEVGLDNSSFNAEFFYDQTHDNVYLLEINPRISQAHTDIFEKVHGVSHHRIMLALALGEKPPTMDKKGRFNKAANFMLRTFEPGQVKRIPTREELDKIHAEFPGTFIQMKVGEGQDLSDLMGQDSYSFELANIYIGGRDQMEISEIYEACLKKLNFEVSADEPILY